jgi:hypothetical protein
MKYFYGILCVLGILLPYGIFIPWLIAHGLNIGMLISEASQTRIGAFAWMDVVVSALALFGFIFIEGKQQGMKKLWIPVLGTCTVGVSLGLPLFLLMREIHFERQKP